MKLPSKLAGPQAKSQAAKPQAPSPKKPRAKQKPPHKDKPARPLKGPNKDPSALTPLEAKYVECYLECLNQTRAYVKAGGSEKTADSASLQMHNRPRVKAKIDEGLAARKDKYEITVARVLRELAIIAFAPRAALYKTRTFSDAEGARLYDVVKPIHEMTEEEGKLLAGVKPTANGTEYKLHDSVKALELLGRHLSLFSDNLNIKGHLATYSPEQLAALSDKELDAVLAAAERVAAAAAKGRTL